MRLVVQKMRRLARKAVAVSVDVASIKMIIQEMNAKAHEDTNTAEQRNCKARSWNAKKRAISLDS